MSDSTKNPSPDANHENTINLRFTEFQPKDLYGYSPLSEKILEDFLRPQAEEGLHFGSENPLFNLIKMEHFKFEQRCLNFAQQFIEGYDGGMWTHNGDGIYCLNAEPTQRFHIANPYNWSNEHCNPLETGTSITLMALDGGMYSAHEDFAKAMIYFRSRLMMILEQQYLDGNALINTSKVLRVID